MGRFLRVWITGGLWLVFLIMTVLSIMGFWGNSSWQADLVSHFRVQYLLGWMAMGICCWALRRYFLLAGSFGGMVLNGVFVFSWPSIGAPSEAESAYSVLSFNMKMRNDASEAAKVLEYVEGESPDLVLLIEVIGNWENVVEPLKKRYPHNYVRYGGTSGGLAFFSRFPLKLIHNRSALVACEVVFPEGELVAIGCHPLSPRRRVTYEARNKTIRSMAEFSAGLENRTQIIMGDFNASPWSPIFEEFLSETGLYLVQSRFLAQATWPTHNPLLWIPIDHFTASPNLQAVDKKIGPNLGSDHYPILMKFQWRR